MPATHITLMGRPPSHSIGSAPRVAIGEWRRRRLIAAGFDPPLAADLAGEPAVDLHQLLTLLDRGCPPQLAARILAPLEDGGS